ncbi:MAG: hepatitis A virus cellular receptor 1 [Bacteroidaceae bacterium]|nr:hepatitis A virus cellular receptor 1 [Bacteroidaceae bacterium]
MKKLLSILSVFLMGLSFVSCEDEMTASTLEGTWEGDMYMYSEYSGRIYEASYSEIEFLKDPFRYTRGKGYWVDYYSNAPWDYIANHIEWEVKDRSIYVYFVEDDVEIEIWDYRLDDDIFSGYIYYDNMKTERFHLHHTSSPHWNDYTYGYDYWYTRAAEGEKPVRKIIGK